MHAYIISGGTTGSRTEVIHKKLTKNTELLHVLAEKTSITIKQIQDLKGPLAITADLPRVVWIEEASLMTIPAQNALLKMLEEPPHNTTFYLTCQSARALLPTIRSRTQLVTIEASTKESDPAVLSNLKQVMSLSAGDRLGGIVKRDRGESIVWISEIEHALADKLNEPNLTPASLTMLGKIAKLASTAHLQLAENCSVSLVTQTFYLLLPHTHTTK